MTQMNPVEIGRKLTELRGEKTRVQVAKDLEISQSALAMYESGQRIPRDNVKIRISDYYQIPIHELFY